MCKTHWNQYTTALRKAALARKAAEGDSSNEGPLEPDPTEAPEPSRTRAKRSGKAIAPEGGAQGAAG